MEESLTVDPQLQPGLRLRALPLAPTPLRWRACMQGIMPVASLRPDTQLVKFICTSPQ